MLGILRVVLLLDEQRDFDEVRFKVKCRNPISNVQYHVLTNYFLEDILTMEQTEGLHVSNVN